MQPDMRGKAGSVRQSPAGAVHASPIATVLKWRHWRGFLIAAVGSVFMALIGAMGSDEAPLGIRLVYWFTVMEAGALTGLAVSELVDRGGWFDDRPAVQGMIIAVAMTIPLTLIVWWITTTFFGRATNWQALHLYLAPVFIVTCVMTALNYFTQRAPAETHAAPAGSAPARFLDRLPARLRGGELFAVEAEDHYLRLHTSKGQDLILMRLTDAVAELEGLEGAQVHRSWWVARGAVAGARRGDGKATLTLTDGAEVPVSRAYAKALRDAGWF